MSTALRELLRRMEGEADPKEWVRLDGELHLRIATASGNDVFSAVLAEIREALAGQSERVNLLPDRVTASNAEHRDIVDAIAAGSADAASAAMSRHLRRVQDALGQLSTR